MAIFRLLDRCSNQCRLLTSLTRFHVPFNSIKDFYLSDTVFFFESYGPHRIFRFKIDKSFYLFINYTLAGIAQDVAKTLSSLSPINELITWRNYIVDSFLIGYEPIVDRNLNAIFSTSATSRCTEHIQAFLDNQSNYLSILSVDIHFSNVTHLLHNSFLLLLSSISSPFFNAVL